MRVAVLSDIHGHLPALDAVLADVDRAAVDRIVLTGDIAGPMPVPVPVPVLQRRRRHRLRRARRAASGAGRHQENSAL